MSAPLVCPSCGTGHELSERFCSACGMPLVHAAGHAEPVSERRERARKVQARYAEGPLVRVATASHQSEAELLQGMLLEEGIPSLVRRSGGFDVPDFLAAGPRDVLVPQSGGEAARELLGTTAPPPREPLASPRWHRALAAALALLVLALLVAWVGAAVWP